VTNYPAFSGLKGDSFLMTRAEAIKQAKILSKQYKSLFVILDKELNDFFITEREDFCPPNDFYKTCNYEIVKTFK